MAKSEQVDLALWRSKELQGLWFYLLHTSSRHFRYLPSLFMPSFVSAKLEPPEGGTVLDGLEMKVAFGDVWKESLSELSGGQR